MKESKDQHRDSKTGESFRDLKRQINKILHADDFESKKSRILEYPVKKAINPLISFLYKGDQVVFHRTVETIGLVVDQMAKEDMESARIVMRRFMWMLNDESGGIGWGIPESMAEVMARNKSLALEYSSILISYLDEEGNFLEYEALQTGLLRGVARLSETRPELMKNAKDHLGKYIVSPDPYIRYYAIKAAGNLSAVNLIDGLKDLETDDSMVKLYRGNKHIEETVGYAAKAALQQMESS